MAQAWANASRSHRTSERYYTALLIASENEQMLESPIGAFVRLDDFLQAWVMQERNWEHFIGIRLGGKPRE